MPCNYSHSLNKKIDQIALFSPLPLSHLAVEIFYLRFKPNIQIIEFLNELKVK